jgi:hypothetical protein
MKEWVVRSTFPPRHDNPLKASRPLSFRLLSPFGKGDFQRSIAAAVFPNSRPAWIDAWLLEIGGAFQPN